MTTDPVPPAAVQILRGVHPPLATEATAQRVVAALHAAGWLTPPDEIAQLRTDNAELRQVAQVARSHTDWCPAPGLRAALDAAPAGTGATGEDGGDLTVRWPDGTPYDPGKPHWSWVQGDPSR